jgi:hypothetical protein
MNLPFFHPIIDTGFEQKLQQSHIYIDRLQLLVVFVFVSELATLV